MTNFTLESALAALHLRGDAFADEVRFVAQHYRPLPDRDAISIADRSAAGDPEARAHLVAFALPIVLELAVQFAPRFGGDWRAAYVEGVVILFAQLPRTEDRKGAPHRYGWKPHLLGVRFSDHLRATLIAELPKAARSLAGVKGGNADALALVNKARSELLESWGNVYVRPNQPDLPTGLSEVSLGIVVSRANRAHHRAKGKSRSFRTLLNPLSFPTKLSLSADEKSQPGRPIRPGEVTPAAIHRHLINQHPHEYTRVFLGPDGTPKRGLDTDAALEAYLATLASGLTCTSLDAPVGEDGDARLGDVIAAPERQGPAHFEAPLLSSDARRALQLLKLFGESLGTIAARLPLDQFQRAARKRQATLAARAQLQRLADLHLSGNVELMLTLNTVLVTQTAQAGIQIRDVEEALRNRTVCDAQLHHPALLHTGAFSDSDRLAAGLLGSFPQLGVLPTRTIRRAAAHFERVRGGDAAFVALCHQHDVRVKHALAISEILDARSIRFARTRKAGQPRTTARADVFRRGQQRVVEQLALSIAARADWARQSVKLLTDPQQVQWAFDCAESLTRASELAEQAASGRLSLALEAMLLDESATRDLKDLLKGTCWFVDATDLPNAAD